MDLTKASVSACQILACFIMSANWAVMTRKRKVSRKRVAWSGDISSAVASSTRRMVMNWPRSWRTDSHASWDHDCAVCKLCFHQGATGSAGESATLDDDGVEAGASGAGDRKSTRLNSSH